MDSLIKRDFGKLWSWKNNRGQKNVSVERWESNIALTFSTRNKNIPEELPTWDKKKFFIQKTADSFECHASTRSTSHSSLSRRVGNNSGKKKMFADGSEKRTCGNYFTGSECGTPLLEWSYIKKAKMLTRSNKAKRQTQLNHAKVK